MQSIDNCHRLRYIDNLIIEITYSCVRIFFFNFCNSFEMLGAIFVMVFISSALPCINHVRSRNHCNKDQRQYSQVPWAIPLIINQCLGPKNSICLIFLPTFCEPRLINSPSFSPIGRTVHE